MRDDSGTVGSDATSMVKINGVAVSLESQNAVTRTVGFECTSGRWIEHEWTGIPADRILTAGEPSADSTHVIVEASDGHTACIELPAALEGLLALARDGEPLDGPRFVSPAIEGPRAVSDVVRLDTIRLAPGEDPTDHESMELVPDQTQNVNG